MKLFVVRHAPVQISGLCYGRTDVPVALPADTAARAALESLEALGPWPARSNAPSASAAVPFASIISSPTARTRTLATAIASTLGTMPLRLDERLCELDFGRWEGRTWADLEQNDGPAFAEWMAHWEHATAPGGEGVQDLIVRLEALLHEIARTEESCLLVTHAGPIRVLRALTQKRTLSDVWSEAVPHIVVESLPSWPG